MGEGEEPERRDREAAQNPASKDPLHGLTLEAILTRLVEDYGWEGLAERIPVRCFQHDPGMKSSLHFLRRTPWAREKVEKLYLGKLKTRKPRKTLPPVKAGPRPQGKAKAAHQAQKGKRASGDA